MIPRASGAIAPRYLVIVVLCLGAALASGCGDDDASGSAGEASAPDATYTVRGRLVDIIGTEVSIQHEAIPDFEDREGETVGMDTMTMPFHKPASVSLEGIERGDAVEVVFDIRWQSANPMSIREIRKLPADTALAL